MIVYIVLLVLVAIGKASCNTDYGGSYKFSSRLEMSDNVSNPVAYQITATANVLQIDENQILAELQAIKLHISTRKLPHIYFKETKFPIGSFKNAPFLIKIKRGVVKGVYIASNEEPAIESIKKGFAGLFQFQIESSEMKESDASGTCDVKYDVSKNLLIKKYKDNCQTTQIGSLWGGYTISHRTSDIELKDGRKLVSVVSEEVHTLKPSLVDFDFEVKSRMDLIYESEYKSAKSLANQDMKTVLLQLENDIGEKYTLHELITENIHKKEKNPPKFSDVIKNNINDLIDKQYGSKTSAKAALNVISAAKLASYDDIYKALKAKSNKKIRGQLIDVLGAVQTKESHKAAKKFLNLTSDNYDLDLCERYLWALSISPNHDRYIIRDLFEILESKVSHLKLFETIIQTISAMVKKYYQDTKDIQLLEETLKLFSEKLKQCKKDDEVCQRIYLKSFSNIASPKVLDVILDHALNGPRRTGTRAMKAVWSLGQDSWNEEVIKSAERILFTNATYDSSSKTIALDILLETNPSNYRLAKILNILKRKEVSKELKEYLLQRVLQISQKNKLFAERVKTLLSTEGLNNYHCLVQGGLSTAFERRFMENGFLSTNQEVVSGLLKQGYVHVNLEENNTVHTVFTLGLFANGLGSFVSSGEGSDSEDDGDVVNAGLELTVLGVEFRPFIFFEGNGELMGHVFSGTASTLTPAYQALLLLEDEAVKIPLAIGQTLEVLFSTVASIDLSGKIEISLWSRTADSLVQNRAGIMKKVSARVTAPFANCEIEHDIMAEPQLSLTSYSEFYDKMGLCLQLQQPESAVEYISVKQATIPNTKHRLKISKVLNRRVPGRSYALNSKNNEMCNTLFPGGK